MRTPENTHFTTFVNKGKREGRSCYTPTPSLGRSLLSQPSLMVQQNEERLRKGDGWQDNARSTVARSSGLENMG